MQHNKMDKYCCEHVLCFKQKRGADVFINFRDTFLSTEQSARTRRINECYCYICKTRAHRLHACLECLFMGCFERLHFHAHAVATQHFIAVEITFGNIYCMSCRDYMYDSEIPMCSGLWLQEESKSLINAQKEGRLRSGKLLGLRRLANLGKTCYMNCVLQVLTHSPVLRNYFLSDKHNINTCQFKGDRQICIACEMSDLFQEFYSGKEDVLVPYKMLHKIWKYEKNLASYRDHCANDFYLTILDLLHEHLQTPFDDNPCCQCIIHQVYTGHLQSDIVCMNCNVARHLDPEEFRNISLDLGYYDCTLKKCLESYTKPEDIQVTCENCNVYSYSSKQLSIQRLPVVINFQFKRMEMQKNTKKGPKKISTFVEFPESLNMTQFLSPVCSTSSSTYNENSSNCPHNNCHNYGLIGVVVHIGNSPFKGHYISYIKWQQNWYMCDDNEPPGSITKVCIEKVLNSEAYILVYHREVMEYAKN